MKQHNEKKITARGFTLVELSVSVAIMILITTMILFNYKKFDSTIVLTNLAYDVGLSIRQAQVYGTGVRGDGTVTKYDMSYGIYFDMTNQTQFILFADSDNVGSDKDGIYGTGDTIVETFKFQSGFKIEKLCYEPSPETCFTGSFHITFKRPNPDAKIFSVVGGVATERSAAIIYIQNPAGDASKKIIVRTTGQISIPSNEQP